MAKLPTRDDLGGLPSMGSRQIARINPSAVSNLRAPQVDYSAVGRAGQKIADIGASLEAKKREQDAYDTERRFQEFRWGEETALDETIRSTAPGTAAGFEDNWTSSYQERAREFFSTVPDHLKDRYDAKLFDAERRFHRTAEDFGRGERKRTALADIDRIRERVALNGNFDEAMGDFEDHVAAIPRDDLPDIEKDVVLKKGRSDLEEDHIRWRVANEDDIPTIRRDLKRIGRGAMQGGVRIEPTNERGLSFVHSKSGARVKVAEKYADRFAGAFQDFEAAGYEIDPDVAETSGFNKRNIRGSKKPSQHSYGNAIDINATRNAVGTKGDIDPVLANEIAKKRGLIWGGNWPGKKRDPMHFEVDPNAADVVPFNPREGQFDPTKAPGLVEAGNIDLDNRMAIKNEDGSLSTESSFSREDNGVEVLLPTIIEGERVSEEEAFAYYKRTGEHLGKFETPQAADAYAAALSERQDQFYNDPPYPNLTAEQRTALLKLTERVKTEQEASRYHQATEKLRDAVARVEDYGELPDDYGLEEALQVVRDNKQTSVISRHDRDMKRAKAIYAAGRTADGTPLEEMPESQLTDHLEKLVPSQTTKEGEYAMRKDVHTIIDNRAKKIRDLRINDPAAAADNSPEVTAAKAHVEKMQKARAAIEDDESAEAQAADAAVTLAMNRFYVARLDAQRRYEIDDYDLRVLTRSEALALLDMPSTSMMNEAEQSRRLMAAAERAREQYGMFADEALDAAVKFYVRKQDMIDQAVPLIKKLAAGEPLSRKDKERMEEAERIRDAEKAFKPTQKPPKTGPDGLPERKGAKYEAWKKALKENIEGRPDLMDWFDKEFGKGAAKEALGT